MSFWLNKAGTYKQLIKLQRWVEWSFPPSVRDLSEDVFAALFAFFIVYRGVLWFRLFTAEITPFFIVPERSSCYFYIGASALDVLTSLVVAIVTCLCSAVFIERRSRLAYRVVRGLACVVLSLFSFVSLVHLNLIFSMNTGLNYDIIQEAFGTMSLSDLISFAPVTHLFILFIPSFILLTAPWTRHWSRTRNLLLFALSLAAVSAYVETRNEYRNWGLSKFTNLVYRNPLNIIVEDISEGIFKKPLALDVFTAKVSPLQQNSVKLVDPSFLLDNTGSRDVIPRPVKPPRLNVVFIILESVGFDYVFSKTVDTPDPMPTLRSLSREGWFFTRHFSTANTSPRALFSIFSGIYSEQYGTFFSARPNLSIPSFFSFLDPIYKTFLVTPGYMRSYFPLGFLHRSGLQEIYGAETIRLEEPSHRVMWSKNELEVSLFFIQKLQNVKEPFAAVYYSYVPHYNYEDYGPEYRIYSNTSNSFNRYLNNLYLLDTRIKLIVDELNRSGRLDRTLLVLVGDHGEAFGQHPENWTHSRYSYNENLHVPVVFFNKTIFPPHIIDTITSHVDILPTLLDALSIPYNPDLIQGESLYTTTSRRFVFAAGNENTSTAISTLGIKTQASFKYDNCWVFNLNADPDEKVPLDCSTFTSEREALIKFRFFQNVLLPKLTKAFDDGCGFKGQKHPALPSALFSVGER